MRQPRPYERIRVIRFRDDRFDATEPRYQRKPRIGDTGTVVDVYPKPVVGFDVECVDPESGNTVWLEPLYPDEIEIVRDRAPREVTIAIALSWIVLVVETADRFRRISTSSLTRHYAGLHDNLVTATVVSAVLVASFIWFASRRHNWARIVLLVSTLGGWLLWLVYVFTISEYEPWQWLAYGAIAVAELAVLLLLFGSNANRWYRSRAGSTATTARQPRSHP